ncbi:hypothetical protein [Minwuia thermotolerans]|uniref:hypothetical protein n=1 Tax=Minwuia thermotolerans TaxID=2056226 RepID=UPI000F62CF30|nr:hypothetical protein [Minwuia thermotolerans]
MEHFIIYMARIYRNQRKITSTISVSLLFIFIGTKITVVLTAKDREICAGLNRFLSNIKVDEILKTDRDEVAILSKPESSYSNVEYWYCLFNISLTLFIILNIISIAALIAVTVHAFNRSKPMALGIRGFATILVAVAAWVSSASMFLADIDVAESAIYAWMTFDNWGIPVLIGATAFAYMLLIGTICDRIELTYRSDGTNR